MLNPCAAILGSTGSIGVQALDVARRNHIKIDAVAACSNIEALECQIREFNPRLCAVYNEAAARELKIKVADTSTVVTGGEDAICEVAAITEADTVINSVIGIAGLAPTLAAINSGKNIALANKETLVCAGELVMKAAKAHNCRIIPVDSEHSAISQCLRAGKKAELEKIIITCSGGPFYGKSRNELLNVTKSDALAHPIWSMGQKITIDSATLMNKGLEVIEAVHLFGAMPEQIEVLIHRECIVHSMVQFCDGAVIAQLGLPDMRNCIQYALTEPDRLNGGEERLDLTAIGKLTFAAPDYDTFVLLGEAISAIKYGGSAPAILNGANERAVELFLNGKISFTDIFDSVLRVMSDAKSVNLTCRSVNDVMEADAAARSAVDTYFGAR